MRIPKTMSTQHPDNVSTPFFATSSIMGGEDEIQEAFYAYSHLGIEEQMWDVEGKEVDTYVVKKLLSKYETYFRKHPLGETSRLLVRVPNPQVETTEAKVLLETLESIPRSYDANALFYGKDIAPIHEVILPMTSSAQECLRIHRYYKQFVSGKANQILDEQGTTLEAWIGEFNPKTIHVIPLFEDKDNMLKAKSILKDYLNGIRDENVPFQRVFFARSDPAMNYGFLSAILLNKLALHDMAQLEQETGIKIYPIIGVGSAPFRGHLTPQRVSKVLEEYPSVHTFTIQSAFKYDHDVNDVVEAINAINSSQTKTPKVIDREKALEFIQRYAAAYESHVLAHVSLINRVSKYVPSRRLRKLHIGLFGYSRRLQGESLPRVITFTATLYSLGCPPELFGLEALTSDDLMFIRASIHHFDDDIRTALKYYNPNSPCVSDALKAFINQHFNDVEFDAHHRKVSDYIIERVRSHQHHDLENLIVQAASFRRFLG